MSSSVGVALSWSVWPGQYTVVLPSHWREDKCRVSIMPAKGQTRYKTGDMVIQSHPPYGVPTPLTLQSRGCGGRGDTIAMSHQYMMTTNITSNTSKLLAHQFVKLRFGIFDERGFPGDPLYPSHYLAHGQVVPTGVSNTIVQGTWLSGPCTYASQVLRDVSSTHMETTARWFVLWGFFLAFHLYIPTADMRRLICLWLLPSIM